MNKIILIVIALLVVSLSAIKLKACSYYKKPEMQRKEIVESGYQYLVYGSQNSNGIEVYDIKNDKFIPIITPEKFEVRFENPVIGRSGKGYCVRIESIEGSMKARANIVSFDIISRTHNLIKTLMINEFNTKMALSPNEKMLSLIVSGQEDSNPVLTIIDTADMKIIHKIVIDERFYQSQVIMTWKPDNKNILLWDAFTDLPAVEININTGAMKELGYLPLDCKDDVALVASDRMLSRVYLVNLKTGNKADIDLYYKTAHSLSLSSDAKYLIYGWLRGIGGFESLVVRDIQSQKEFQLKLKNHPSTVMGLSLW